MSDMSAFRVFEPLVNSFSLNAPPDAPHWQSRRLVEPLRLASGPGQNVSAASEIRLWFDARVVPGMGAFDRKLSSWLNSLEIVSDQSVVNATLAIIAALSNSGQTLMSQLTALLSSARLADVSHFVILNTNLPDSWMRPLEWNGFEFGPANLNKIEKRCARAGETLDSDALSLLRGRPAVSSPVYRKKVFDLQEFLPSRLAENSPVGAARLRYEWFKQIAHAHHNQMWADFEERRALLYALGYGFVDGNTFRDYPAQFLIACYLKIRSHSMNEGEVIFGQPFTRITLPDLAETENAIQQLDALCPSSLFIESALHKEIKAFAMTLCRGTRIAVEGHACESYLHHIIALEQLFSTREKTSQAVASRTAILVYRQLGMTYDDCRKTLLKDHYEARSKFVHSASPIPLELFEPIYNITQCVLRSLLWLAKSEESRSKNFYDNWIKRLDWLIAGHEAGMIPSDNVLDENGIITSDTLALP